MASPPSKVDTFDPRNVRLCHRQRSHYSDNDLARILSTLPKRPGLEPAEILRRLETAAVEYFVADAWQDQPTKQAVARRMGQVATVAKRLLRTLGFDQQRHHPDLTPRAIHAALVARSVLTARPDEHVRQTILAVFTLYQLAKSAATDQPHQGDSNANHARNKADAALNGLMLSIGEIWRVYARRKPGPPSTIGGQSRNRGRPAGPFLQFVRASITPLGIKLTDHALRARLRSVYRSKAKSPSKNI
jgi:phosphoenolpyruvate carboxylase